MAGAIHRERIHAFEQMLWRICRGNVFIRYSEILMPLSDPHTVNHCPQPPPTTMRGGGERIQVRKDFIGLANKETDMEV